MTDSASIRVAVTLSPYQMRMLRMWAALNGRPPSTFAAQILSSRIESNLDLIRTEFEEMAKVSGLTPDEMLQHLYGDDA